MARLTEANYTSRRIKLVQHIAAAEDAVAETAFRVELDDATEADLKAARSNVETLKDRLSGLDLAWKRTQENDAAEARAKRLKARSASHDVAKDALALRAGAAEKMEQAIRSLTEGYHEYQGAGQAVLNEAVKHRDVFGMERIADLKEDVRGQFVSIESAILGALRYRGLDLVNVGVAGNNSTGSDRHSNVVWLADFANGRIEASIAPLVEPSDQGAA